MTSQRLEDASNRNSTEGQARSVLRPGPEPWKIAPGDASFVFVPGVVKPINCGSKERARLIAAAPDLLNALAAACTSLELHAASARHYAAAGWDTAANTGRYFYDLYREARDDGEGRDTMRAGHPLWTFNQWRLTEGRKFK